MMNYKQLITFFISLLVLMLPHFNAVSKDHHLFSSLLGEWEGEWSAYLFDSPGLSLNEPIYVQKLFQNAKELSIDYEREFSKSDRLLFEKLFDIKNYKTPPQFTAKTYAHNFSFDEQGRFKIKLAEVIRLPNGIFRQRVNINFAESEQLNEKQAKMIFSINKDGKTARDEHLVTQIGKGVLYRKASVFEALSVFEKDHYKIVWIWRNNKSTFLISGKFKRVSELQVNDSSPNGLLAGDSIKIFKTFTDKEKGKNYRFAKYIGVRKSDSIQLGKDRGFLEPIFLFEDGSTVGALNCIWKLSEKSVVSEDDH